MAGTPAASHTDAPDRDKPGDDPRAVLHRHGLRCTSPRLAVLGVLAGDAAPGHRSVAEIHRRLRDCGHDVDLTTVYRTVSALADAGIVHTLALHDRVTYGLADRPHHHAVCTRCATISEIPAEILADAVHHASAGTAYRLPDTGGLTLHGLCPACQQHSGRLPRT